MDDESVAKVLLAMAQERGPSFLKYDEASKCKDCKVSPKQILKQKDVVKQLADMKPVPAKSVIKAAIQSMLTYMNETWKLKDAEHSDYISTMTCRIANVMHVVQQAKLKRPSPKW